VDRCRGWCFFAACFGQIGGQASLLDSRSAIGDGLKAFVKNFEDAFPDIVVGKVMNAH